MQPVSHCNHLESPISCHHVQNVRRMYLSIGRFLATSCIAMCVCWR